MDEKTEYHFLKTTIESIKSVFNIMVGINVEDKKVIISNKDGIRGDVTGIIGLSNDEIKGSMAITFPKELGKMVVANMLAIEPKDVTEEEIKDGLGEITNMVAGDLNNRIGNIFRLSLPSVITGDNHLVSLKHDKPPVVFKFFALNNFFHTLTILERQR